MCTHIPVDNQKQSYKAAPHMEELQTASYLFECDEDVFYCELKKQVLQLTAEDEEEEDMNEGRKQGGPCRVSRDRVYYNWPMNKEDFAAPAWMLNLWRTGNGTGVFIPQIVQAKKNRSRRKNGRGRRTYEKV